MNTTNSNNCNLCGGDASTIEVKPLAPTYMFYAPAEREEKERLNQDIKNAYATLQMYGVPELRAKTVANGIQVLVSRLDKEANFQDQELAAEREKTADCTGCKNAGEIIASLATEITELKSDAVLWMKRDLCKELENSVLIIEALEKDRGAWKEDSELWQTRCDGLEAQLKSYAQEAWDDILYLPMIEAKLLDTRKDMLEKWRKRVGGV